MCSISCFLTKNDRCLERTAKGGDGAKYDTDIVGRKAYTCTELFYLFHENSLAIWFKTNVFIYTNSMCVCVKLKHKYRIFPSASKEQDKEFLILI